MGLLLWAVWRQSEWEGREGREGGREGGRDGE